MGGVILLGISALAGAGVTFLIIPLTIRWARSRKTQSGAREIHHTHHGAVSRLGGLALAAAFAVGAAILFLFDVHEPHEGREIVVIVVGALAMFSMGFWDDLKRLGAKLKLLWQILIALGIWWLGIRISFVSNPIGGTAIDLGLWWSAVVTIIWLVGLTNLINLIDGLDGLAGGLSLVLIGLMAFLRFQSGGSPVICVALFGGLVVFLCFNFPPARIYLGDGGAYFLGFTIGALTIVSSHKGTVMAALIAPLFVLTLPIIDVSLAILRRGLKGLPIFRPDREHIHHRLLEMGMSRRKAVLSLYAFTLFFLALALGLLWGEGRTLPIMVGFGTLCLLLLAGQFNFSREWFAVGRVLGNSVGMREEVAYALSITRWLERETQRVQNMEEFWKVMTFAVERMGFVSLSLELPDGRREWKIEDPPLAFHHRKFNLNVNGAGIVELRSRVCNHHERNVRGELRSHHCGRAVPCVGDRRVFTIVSELFIEVWHKASQEFRQEAPVLQFDTQFTRRRSSDTTIFTWIRRLGDTTASQRVDS